MIRRLLIVLLMLLAGPAAAQQTLAGFLEGSWGLRAGGSIVMRFDLERTTDGWAGTWTKPTSFRSDGMRFGQIVMPAVTRTADRGQAIGEWAEITFDDPRPNEEPDQFRIRLLGPDRAELLYVGTGLPPFTLERVAAGAPLGPFEEGAVYGGPPPTPRPAAAPPPAQTPVQQPAPAPAQTPAPPPPLPPMQPRPERVRPVPQTPPPAEEPPVQGPPAMIGR